MSEASFTALCNLIQEDPGKRGLRKDPTDNLITRTQGDFEAACRSLAQADRPCLAVVTGFYIATANPPCGVSHPPTPPAAPPSDRHPRRWSSLP